MNRSFRYDLLATGSTSRLVFCSMSAELAQNAGLMAYVHQACGKGNINYSSPARQKIDLQPS
jgi:hypothetical protein